MVPPLLKEKYQFYHTTLCIPYIVSSCSLYKLTFSQLSSSLLLCLGFAIHTRLFLISRLYLLYYALSWLPGNLPQPASKVISSHTVLRWSDRINHPHPVRSTATHMVLYSTFHRRLLFLFCMSLSSGTGAMPCLPSYSQHLATHCKNLHELNCHLLKDDFPELPYYISASNYIESLSNFFPP